MDWECLYTTEDLQRIHILRGYLEAEGMHPVVMPRRVSVYTFASAGVYELWVPITEAPTAFLKLDEYTHPPATGGDGPTQSA